MQSSQNSIQDEGKALLEMYKFEQGNENMMERRGNVLCMGRALGEGRPDRAVY